MPIDRRTVLAATTAGAAIMAVDAPGHAADRSQTKPANRTPRSVPKERIVTLEEHFFPGTLMSPDVAKAFLAPNIAADAGEIGERRLRAMDENGITVQVLSASPPPEPIEGQEGIRLAQRTNDMVAEAMQRHPGRFAAFANLPTSEPEAAADELERSVTRLGFCGALINGAIQGHFLDDARFAPLLARAAKLGVPLYLHPHFPLKPVTDAYYAGLPGNGSKMLAAGMFGFHVEVGAHILRLALAGTLEQHEGLNIIIGHMGETLPFMMDRIDHIFYDLQNEPGVSPTNIIRERVHITTSGFFSTPALLCALTTFGADRIMFSVDYPFSRPERARKWLDSIPLAPADRQKIVHGNADRLLKLTGRV